MTKLEHITERAGWAEACILPLTLLLPRWAAACAGVPEPSPLPPPTAGTPLAPTPCLTRLHVLLYKRCLLARTPAPAELWLPAHFPHFERGMDARAYMLAHYYGGMLLTRLGRWPQALHAYQACLTM